ncbi:MAG: amino acid dehydrogenase [Deltaproteobacteria bacterium]|nr:MAG: amino acid dehydrogenase [Deltaproteobacteria bacterium]
MDLFQTLQQLRFGEVHVAHDERTGLRAIVALHSTRLGPAIGGCRAIHYPDSGAALHDAVRLARGMSYKAAICNLPHGGGKAVIMLPQDDDFDRQALFHHFGKFVDSLGGRYITAEDSGTSPADMDVIGATTPHVLGTSVGGGDPSPFTAFGVRRGIEAVAAFQFERSDLDGLHVAIQGLGSVGFNLARELHDLGCSLTVTDIRPENVQRAVESLGATAVDPDDIFAVECDIFAPCALGAVINDTTLPMLRTRAIAGAANNVLAEDRHGIELFRKGILYAPDYAINAGGLIKVACEFIDTDADANDIRSRVAAVHDIMTGIFERARREDVPTHIVADRIAEERIYAD